MDINFLASRFYKDQVFVNEIKSNLKFRLTRSASKLIKLFKFAIDLTLMTKARKPFFKLLLKKRFLIKKSQNNFFKIDL